MKPILTVLFVVALSTGAAQAAGKKIQTLDAFKAAVVNKTLANKDGSVKVRANGKVTGKLQGKKITGAWNWQGKKFCRALKWGGQDMGSTCQTIRVDGKNVHFIRSNGSTTSYVIK